MGAGGLAVEVALAVVGAEEGADGEILVEGDEIAVGAVETGAYGVAANDLEDAASDRGIPECLGFPEVFVPRDSTELGAVFGVVLTQLLLAVESKLRPGNLGYGLALIRIRF